MALLRVVDASLRATANTLYQPTMSVNNDDASSVDHSIPEGLVIFTEDELLYLGLRLIRYKCRRINRARKATNIKRFRKNFGGVPDAVNALWEDLQTTDDPEAFLEEKDRDIKKLLMALYQIKKYPTEEDRERIFDLSHSWSREKVWFYLEKIQALKKQKIVWPENNEDIWVCTVDGTHCWVQEQAHPEFSLDPEYFSHKHNKCGIVYELAISLREQRLIWMNGGFKAGRNDVSIFTAENGLKVLLEQTGKMAIGDGGYQGHEEQCSTPNSIDSRPVRKFKSRALKRHEKFNGYTKRYDCLKGRFRHSPMRFNTCFEAVCVMVQYQLDVGQDYLYDIVVEDILYDD